VRRLALSLLLGVAAAGLAGAQGAYEAQPVLKAADLAPASVLKGPGFTVDAKVPTPHFLGQFTLRSTAHGKFDVHGRDLLPVRVAELGALDQLAGMSKSEEFLKAAGNAAARPVRAVVEIASSPIESAKAAPAAFGRFFERMELGAKSVAGAASAPDKSSEEKAAETTKRVGSIGIDVLGFEQERRGLAKRLNVDPYTTNPVLSEKLTDIAWVAFSGRFGVGAATAVIVPFSSVLTLTSATRDIIWDTPPGDLILQNQKRFAVTGASEEQVRALMTNKWYSLSVLTHLAVSLEALGSIPGREQIVVFAARAENEDVARIVAGAVAMLATYHGKGQRLTRVAAPGPIVGHGRGVIVPAPLDYVAWTERVARLSKRKDLAGTPRVVWIPGTFSPRAKKELAAAGWALHEGATPLAR
jgi:hypothetical protein